MSALDRLTAAGRALDEARQASEKIAAARDRLDDRANELESQRETQAARLASAVVDVEIGDLTSEDLASYRREVDRLTREVTEACNARDACDLRARQAELSEADAETELQRALADVALPVYGALRDEIRATAKQLYRLQALWLRVAETGGTVATPWSGDCHTMHGDRHDKASLSKIAESAGIDLATMGPHADHRPVRRLSPDEMRTLATNPLAVETIAPVVTAPTPVLVPPERRRPRDTRKARPAAYVADDGIMTIDGSADDHDSMH